MIGPTLQKKVLITNPEGFHMRPATHFAVVAQKFQSEVWVVKEDRRVNGKSPFEMMTMYTLDDGDLTATHSCAAGNQPNLRYNAAKSSADKLVFDFVGVQGPKKAGYMHDAEFDLTGADSMHAVWNGKNADGSPGDTHTFTLTRAK